MPGSSAPRSGAMPASRPTTSIWSECSPRPASSRTRCAPACSMAPRSRLVRQLAGSRWPRRDQAAPGTLGETRLTPQGYFHAELRGLSQPLAQSTLEVFSPNCRADLGDHRCKFPIQPPELGRDQTVSARRVLPGADRGRHGLGPLRGPRLRGDRSGHDRIEPARLRHRDRRRDRDGTATLKAYDSFTRVAPSQQSPTIGSSP